MHIKLFPYSDFEQRVVKPREVPENRQGINITLLYKDKRLNMDSVEAKFFGNKNAKDAE